MNLYGCIKNGSVALVLYFDLQPDGCSWVHPCVWPAARTVSHSEVRQIPTWASYLCGEPHFLSDNTAFDSRQPHWNQDTSARRTIIAQWNNRVHSAWAHVIANASASRLSRSLPFLKRSIRQKYDGKRWLNISKGKVIFTEILQADSLDWGWAAGAPTLTGWDHCEAKDPLDTDQTRSTKASFVLFFKGRPEVKVTPGWKLKITSERLNYAQGWKMTGGNSLEQTLQETLTGHSRFPRKQSKSIFTTVSGLYFIPMPG